MATIKVVEVFHTPNLIVIDLFIFLSHSLIHKVVYHHPHCSAVSLFYLLNVFTTRQTVRRMLVFACLSDTHSHSFAEILCELVYQSPSRQSLSNLMDIGLPGFSGCRILLFHGIRRLVPFFMVIHEGLHGGHFRGRNNWTSWVLAQRLTFEHIPTDVQNSVEFTTKIFAIVAHLC